jgi:hypothetical protein
MNRLVAYLALIFINIVLSVGSEDCSFISNFFKNKEIFVLNEAETIEFLPSEYSHIDSGWDDVCVNTTSCVIYGNEVNYKNKRIRSLSDTELGITDKDFTEAIYKSFINNEILHDVISVFTNRYVVRTRSTKVLVYSIHYGIPFNIISPASCKNYLIRYQMSKIKGFICKIGFISGVRSQIKCDDITLYLNPIDENGNIDCETKCQK